MEHEGVRRGGAWIACVAGFWIVLAMMVFGSGHMMGSGPVTWAVLALVAYLGWRWWNGHEFRDGFSSHRGRDRAYRVLRERFANGEIDEAEYQARKGVLSE